MALYPIKAKSSNWGFIIGLSVVVITAKMVYRFTDDLLKVFIVAIIVAVLAIFGAAIIVYKTTSFTSILF